jgi:transcription antitermination factor NusG
MNMMADFKAAGLIDEQPITPSYSEPRAWYVLLTLPGNDKRAADWMEKTKQAIYWPHFCKTVAMRSGKRVGRVYSVVPGYVFAAGALGKFPDIERCPYLREPRFLISDGRAALVPERDIQAIRSFEAKLNLPLSDVEWTWQPAKGQAVRFTEELWSDKIGNVVDVANPGRIGVEVELLGRKTLFWVSTSQIAPM